MLVSDVYEDAKEYLGFGSQDKIFGRLTDAIEALANKGPWEPLLAYMDINVQNNVYITLPDTVEVPLRINLNSNPSFPRDKMYEFTMNGPGTSSERVDWSWEDRGETQTVNPTTGVVTRSANRVIKISKSGVSVRMLVRLRTSKITSMNQWIPLHSKLAILLMLKALECYRRGTPQDFQLGQAQEQQALQFLQEEQKSRNVFADISAVMDSAPMIGYQLAHVRGAVLVLDIYDEASAICGGIGQQHVFDRISEAVEVLANKGQWDSMVAYMDIIPDQDIVALPRVCETPLRININKKPALARNRMFEFSVNGPGSDMKEVTSFTWVDQGFSPVLTTRPFPTALSFGGSSQDEGKSLTVEGIDINGVEKTSTYRIPSNEGPEEPSISSPIIWKQVTKITKDVTTLPVSLRGNGGVLVGFYYPEERVPQYRLIKLGKPAEEVRVMFRKDTRQITSVVDFIPLTSRQAILLMLRALSFLKSQELTPDKIQSAQVLEAQALKYLQEEEQSKLGYIQMSSKDQLPAFGINTSVRNVVIAGDVYDDAADIFGAIGQQRLFDKITEAMELLSNKSQWDGLEGYVDILTDGRGYATLPRKVEVPVAINFWKTPAEMRSKWYEFHLNGMGSDNDVICGNYWDDLGEYPLVIEPDFPVQLHCTTLWSADAATKIRAYGYSQSGDWIRSYEGGKVVDGELVPVRLIHGIEELEVPEDIPDAQQIPKTHNFFRQVTRITKDPTAITLQLYGSGINADRHVQTSLLGYYEPNELEPMYRRIKIPKWVSWIRMRYRKNNLKITQMSDVLNLKSKTALVTAMRAIKELNGGDLNLANALEAKAVQLVSDEQMSRNPSETFTLQFDSRTSWADPLQGRVR